MGVVIKIDKNMNSSKCVTFVPNMGQNKVSENQR